MGVGNKINCRVQFHNPEKRHLVNSLQKPTHCYSLLKDVAALIMTFTETRQDAPMLFCLSGLLTRTAKPWGFVKDVGSSCGQLCSH